MSSKFLFFRHGLISLLVALTLAACTTVQTASKAVRANENTPEAALGYYQGLARMTPAELGRERMVLVASAELEDATIDGGQTGGGLAGQQR